jgi:hypothetical protein
MAYSVNLLECPVSQPLVVMNHDLQGFPTPFRYLLLSMWGCLGTLNRTISFGNTINLGAITATQTGIVLNLRAGVSSPTLINATFGTSLAGGVLQHILISLDGVAQTAQVYVNDVPLSISTGGWVGPSSQFFTAIGPVCDWDLSSVGSIATPPLPGQGDVFVAAPSSFFDLSVTTNRRQFINHDLTAVDLGNTAVGPLGAPPQIWLTARSGVPDDFRTNRGSGGGVWSLGPSTPPLSFLAAGTCVAPTPPPPDEIEATLTDAELLFSDTPGFVDLSDATTRRRFISSGGTPAWVEANGALAFGGEVPPVYLSVAGNAPNTFADNNGTGGPLSITSGPLTLTGGPGCTPYYLTEAAGPAADPQWRLTVSDDGGRTWSTLVKVRSIGKLGEYLTRLRWQKMGQSRERMIKLECTDPVRRNIVGVYIDQTQGMG